MSAMKNIDRLFIFLLVPFALTIATSCTKNDSPATKATGSALFSINLSSEQPVAKNSSGDSLDVAWHLMISIEDLNGNAVMTDSLIPLYVFGTGFMSEKIELKTGQYNLIKFLVIDPSGSVIYASPLDGSPLSYLSKDPLPMKFSVDAGKVTSIIPEVLTVGTHTPSDFGYASFGVQIINPLEVYVICYLYNPLLMAPTTMTDATLSVTAADGWSYTFQLKAEVNHITIRGGSDYYTLVVKKEGYDTQIYTFSGKELEGTSQENPLGLKIPWGPQPKIITIQPGPDDGKDALISNLQPDKNFGDSQYFEATFLTEPVLTVMRSNRSLIAFNLDSLPKNAVISKVTLVLYFDLPVPMDSTYLVPDATGAYKYKAAFQSIIEPWDEHKVTWNNQPATSELNQVFLYPFIRNANFIEIDVTGLFNNPSASVLPFYGLMFREYPDENFPGFRFVSGDYGVEGMRPRLVVEVR